MRTNPDAVQAVLRQDWDGSTDLQPFIDTASNIVDAVSSCSALKNKQLTNTTLELIERWLSAHMYVMTDQVEASKSAGKGSATWQGQTGMALDASKYGQMAKMVDVSGCLTNIEKRQFAGFSWLGSCGP